MVNDILYAFWVFLPAGVANMSPVLASYIPLLNNWNTPVDFGKTWYGNRLLGDNKRFRGVLVGVLSGLVISIGQFSLNIYYQSGINSISSAAFSGVLLGFGAMIGDIVESFFKRRRKIKSGDSWFPFDQTDYIFGGLACWLWFVNISWQLVVYIFVVYFGLHLLVRYIGYKLGINDKAI